MREWTANDGKVYPISDGTAKAIAEQIGENWPSLNEARLAICQLQRLSENMPEVERERHVILASWLMGCEPADIEFGYVLAYRLHNLEPGDRSKHISAKLYSLDWLVNMNSAIGFLRGRDFRELFETIDSVHGNTQFPDCGCVLTVLFDHLVAQADPKMLVTHPHYPVMCCERHKSYLADFKEHYRIVSEEQQWRSRRLRYRALRLFGQKATETVLTWTGIRTKATAA